MDDIDVLLKQFEASLQQDDAKVGAAACTALVGNFLKNVQRIADALEAIANK